MIFWLSSSSFLLPFPLRLLFCRDLDFDPTGGRLGGTKGAREGAGIQWPMFPSFCFEEEEEEEGEEEEGDGVDFDGEEKSLACKVAGLGCGRARVDRLCFDFFIDFELFLLSGKLLVLVKRLSLLSDLSRTFVACSAFGGLLDKFFCCGSLMLIGLDMLTDSIAFPFLGSFFNVGVISATFFNC